MNMSTYILEKLTNMKQINLFVNEEQKMYLKFL